MKKYIINLILCIPFILSILFFIKRSTMQDVLEVNGVLIEQGFGYSAMGVIFVYIRYTFSLYKNRNIFLKKTD